MRSVFPEDNYNNRDTEKLSREIGEMGTKCSLAQNQRAARGSTGANGVLLVLISVDVNGCGIFNL